MIEIVAVMSENNGYSKMLLKYGARYICPYFYARGPPNVQNLKFYRSFYISIDNF